MTNQDWSELGVVPNSDGEIETTCLSCGGPAVLWRGGEDELKAHCIKCKKLDAAAVVDALRAAFKARQSTRDSQPKPTSKVFASKPLAVVTNGGTNGHVVKLEDDPKQALLSWQLELTYGIKQALAKPTIKNWLETDPASLRLNMIDSFKANGRPLALQALSDAAIEDAIFEVVSAYVPLPATAPDPYENRHSMDAYEVYQQLLAEDKTYSWAGLVRDGGSLLISAVIGAGKTTLALNIVKGWAEGGLVLDRQCRQGITLVVVSPKEYDNWAETIGKWELRGLVYIIESPKAHFGSPVKAADWFEAEMDKVGARNFALDTLFDFYGHSTTSAQNAEVNREVMNEQAPLLMKVRSRNWSGIVTGHSPKSEAQAVNPRDPEEAFSGANAWAAQHRMRVRLRRAGELTGIMSGRGGFGDTGILEEYLLAYDKDTRLVSLGGLWSQKEGLAAMPIVVRTIQALGGGAAMHKLVENTGKSESFLRAGLRAAQKEGLIRKDGKGRMTRWVLTGAGGEDDQGELL